MKLEKFKSVQDVALTLDEAEKYLGNYWPRHGVDMADMVALQETYGKVKEAAAAVWKLESLLTHTDLEKLLAGRP